MTVATNTSLAYSIEDPSKAATLICCYSRRDYKYLMKLRTHLGALRRQGLIADWFDRQIEPGNSWRTEIDQNLATAQIILLLISADFLDSYFCCEVEMRRALERHHAGEARVIPVILRPCDWETMPFGELQVLPPSARPATRWKTLDDAFYAVAACIRKLVECNKIASNKLTEGSLKL
jgi:TIR domain